MLTVSYKESPKLFRQNTPSTLPVFLNKFQETLANKQKKGNERLLPEFADDLYN